MGYTAWVRDYTLVQRSLHGDLAAWETLYCEGYKTVFHAARRCNAARPFGPETLDEIVAEAFLRGYRRRECYLPIVRFSSWICGFMRFVSLEQCRKTLSQERKLQRCRDAVALLPTDTGNPELLYIEKERSLCLWSAFASLTPLHRLLLSGMVLDLIHPAAGKAGSEAHAIGGADRASTRHRGAPPQLFCRLRPMKPLTLRTENRR